MIINEGLEIGSQMEYIRRARSAGYAVIVTNTNLNEYGCPRFLRRNATRPIRVNFFQVHFNKYQTIFQGSGTAEEHGCYVWEHFVRSSHAQHICIMAHSYGGAVVLAMV